MRDARATLVRDDDPAFAGISDFAIVPFAQDVENQFLSEREVVRRRRSARALRTALGAGAFLGLVVLSGTGVPGLTPNAVQPSGMSDRPRLAAVSRGGPPEIASAGQPGRVAAEVESNEAGRIFLSPAVADTVAENRMSVNAATASGAATNAPVAVTARSSQYAVPMAGGGLPDARGTEPRREGGMPPGDPPDLLQPVAGGLPVLAPIPAAVLPVTRLSLSELTAPVRDTIEPTGEPAAAAADTADTARAVIVPPPWRDLLAGYRTAYERLDAQLAKQVWPAVDERALARAFEGLESQTVTFDTCSVTPGNDRVVASCRGSATYVTRMGHRISQTERRQWTFQLERSPQQWIIESVEIR
jgi:hypothetical protein